MLRELESAKLCQLRGRDSHGARKSKFILVASTASSLNRLNVLEKSSDGFHLASVDLLGGPGDLHGKKQSGHLPEFPFADWKWMAIFCRRHMLLHWDFCIWVEQCLVYRCFLYVLQCFGEIIILIMHSWQ